MKKVKPTSFCDECNSEYYNDSSKVIRLCPECSFRLYNYDNCKHKFENGRCIICYWNGNISNYLKNQ
ncbi:hypothetical protein PG911_07755 [Tenacibaculum ovolyticum]|uniref:hypothetical protein n=1 Tax=Tenacibaculum ovolyticum TaxID=104270 RepID=UPI0009EE642E|nr:hypothetical protein [Tenacibaculum ovolyticum]WBX78142.1 hypothetical protein PG911_07755 [Tenacibaculum ovolyticum]